MGVGVWKGECVRVWEGECVAVCVWLRCCSEVELVHTDACVAHTFPDRLFASLVWRGTGCSHFLIVTVLGDTGWDYVTPLVHSVAINGARICNPAFPCSAGIMSCGETFTCGGSTGTSGMCRLLCVWHV